MRERLAHYQILRQLGEGGMGVVYAARDERLGRTVAIKTIHDGVGDPQGRERLWREARAAASLNHPNICQVYAVDEEDGILYVVMELLTGEPLSARITRGALPVGDAVECALAILAALDALHLQNLIHRDLKPSNVFLTEHGAKLLDFGLVRPVSTDLLHTNLQLTMPGTAVGTPRYMAPEQWAKQDVGPACDLFATGALLFEMLTGRPAFGGSSLLEVYHAIVYEEPPALAGDATVMALDRVLQRALAKRPAERYASAAQMAAELRSVARQVALAPAANVRAITRLMVLPFRMLRPDPDLDFLAFSLPDAITTSLSGLPELVVRGSAAAARYGADAPDLKQLAQDAGVDAVLFGTLLRAGDQVRVTTQLVEASTGTILSSRTAQVGLRDIFELQDELTAQIVQSLEQPLAGPPGTSNARGGPSSHASLSTIPAPPAAAPARRDAPSDAKAYELYLRANQLSFNMLLLAEARDLYRACLELDAGFAPAWARLGRVYRVMAKYGHADSDQYDRLAQEAFDEAFRLNPELTTAHNLYTNFEVEAGRSREAMVRLLARVEASPTDPELFTGLVLACRFCGLLEASVAADRRARRLDPGVRTSVAYTYWILEDYANAIHYDDEQDRFVLQYSLPMMGRTDEAIARYHTLEATGSDHQRGTARAARAALELDRDACVSGVRAMVGRGFHDPEGLMYAARGLSRVGALEQAVEMLTGVVDGGFCCARVLRRDPWLEPLRNRTDFEAITVRAERAARAAAEAYRQAGGERLLGASPG